MSHSTHSSAPPVQGQGNAGAQQQNVEAAAAPSSQNAASQHVYQHSVQQPAAPGETDNIQPEFEVDSGTPEDGESDNDPSAATSSAANVDDLERGLPNRSGQGSASTNNNAPGSDNTMNEDGGGQGAGYPGNIATGHPDVDAEMEFATGSTLPPINTAGRQQKDNAAMKAAKEAQECQQFKLMTLESKKKVLDSFNPQDYYVKGAFVDAQDTTNVFIMAQITETNTNEIKVNYDGWPGKWDQPFRKRSSKVAPFRTQHVGYSGQTKVAIRSYQEAISLDEVQFHINTIESYISNDFEGKTAHKMTQYFRGHLFVFLDSLLGVTHPRSLELDADERSGKGKHPFEHSLVQKLFRSFLRFMTAYFRKLATLGQSILEWNQVPRLFLVDPQAAIVAMHPELAELLKRIFASEGRTNKSYILKDENQLPRAEIKRLVDQGGEAIVPNTYGEVVRDYTQIDFVGRRHPSNQEYIVEQVIQRTNLKREIVFGTLSNYVQYFAEIGGFDAMMALFRMGMQPERAAELAVPASKQSSSQMDAASVKLPFNIMNCFIQAFSHLEQTITEEFAMKICKQAKELLLTRLDTMTERDLKDVGKDEIAYLVGSMREFLMLSVQRSESDRFMEETNLQFALRFLKSENLEKRLKGLNEIRYMVERAHERFRFERWQQKTGKSIQHWNSLIDNKDKPYPSEVIKVSDLKQWLFDNGVLQIILGPNSHVEIVKRCGPILKMLPRYGENLFDQNIVELIWKCQIGKHEEVVRTVYNLIQEVLPTINNLSMVNCLFEKIKQFPPPAIDEKYINFMRECSIIAFKQQFRSSQNAFMQENQGGDESEQRYVRMLQLQENKNIESLTSSNAIDLAAQLSTQTSDYGLSLFWQICQDHEAGSGVAPLSNELHELTIESMQQIFSEQSVKQVRSQYLFKAIQNILNFKSQVQSIFVLDPIMKRIQEDQLDNDYMQQSEDLNAGIQNSVQTKPLVLSLNESVHIINSLVNNIEAYHGIVKQKCKQLYKSGGTVPEKLDEHVFYGRYPHNQTLEKTLDFIEFILCQGQKAVDSNEMPVTLGIENIKRLWILFVKEPNFQSDQTQFLNWINKVRTHTVTQIVNYQKKSLTYELFIFSEEEKKFLFDTFLCNPDEVDAAQISVALVKCFQKYFRLINQSQQFMLGHKQKIRVLHFDKLIGMDALWKMALLSQNEKAKEISQELLVSLHLKFDNQNATREHKQAVINSFVARCMAMLSQDANKMAAGNLISTMETSQSSVGEKKAVTQLLALFLDRYEGIRLLKPEQSLARLTNIKPFEINVLTLMDPEQRYLYPLTISYFQTLGHLRAKIAKELNLQINEFRLILKQNEVDPDIDDDIYIKDLNHVPTKCSIKRNPNYDTRLHPKYLLAKNQQNFTIIFSMLWAGEPELCEPVWALISKLPKNESIIENLRTLKFIKDVQPAGDATALKAAWSSLLDPQATFKLLYCLQIMQQEFMSVMLPQGEEDYDDDMLHAYEKQRVWRQQFIQLGGFTHLMQCVVQLNLDEIRSSLELKAIKSVISAIMQFIKHANEIQQLADQESKQVGQKQVTPGLMQQQTREIRHSCVLKVVQLIDAVCKYSIDKESARGMSVEVIQKRIEQAKQRKQRQILMVLGNKAEKAKQVNEDDDDGDSDDKKVLQGINSAFKEQAEIVNQLFNLINLVIEIDPETPNVIINYPNLGQMLERGMILSENRYLRENMSRRIQFILTKLHDSASKAVQESASAASVPTVSVEANNRMRFAQIMDILLTMIDKCKTLKNESRCSDFYEHLCVILVVLDPEDLNALEAQILRLIDQLPKDIRQRPTKEKSSSDSDIQLGGLMNILTNILMRFPQFKRQVGGVLTQYLIHDCLFEIPHGSKNAPKCKSNVNRKKAFDLLLSLSTDCLDNLNVVLDYMKRFNENPSWRTNKESDWNIHLYQDEKSTTGHVGIKNLGCICYMNSLHQQLFMVPGFRNDILSVKDPNHDKNPDEDNMFLQFQTLFAGLLLSQKMYVNPKSYCHAFKDWEGQPVNVFEQMDVEEYLTMFMDRLEAAIKGTPQEKTIQYHFGGKFANEVICKTCPHVYGREEAFLSIGVPVKNKKSFAEGMEAFIAGDMLDQDNQYYCEKCDKKVDALKRTCMKEMPRYMITALKRFDFDFDAMMRRKLNDYFEFQVEVDMREYTQEYLTQKEKQEKDREERKKSATGAADDDEAMEEIKMTNPPEYYQFELVGVIVHAGTADSGHYYSYIKEQETFRLEADGKDKWYEFNDSYVRGWDPSEMPAETFGGEETSYNSGGFGNNQKVLRMRNAYVLIYKRKLTDESLIVTDEVAQPLAEGAAQQAKPEEQKYKLGAETLVLEEDNRLNKKIQWDNHRYWHIRYLFRDDYQFFVTKTALYWNTVRIIPKEVTWRNQDYHLLDPKLTSFQVEQKTTLQVDAPNDVSLDLSTLYPQEAIQEAKFRVFKFAVQFYYTIQQRSQQKWGLPDMSRFLKTYINEDVRCARWFVNEFINCELLKEIMMQNCQKIMRQVYIGIVTCAMLKVFEDEKDQLNFYWDDVEANVENPRQTTLGNYINTLLFLLPQLKDFSANQAQFLQLISQFCRMGIQSKRYLIRADAIQRLLNFFYYKHTPFREDFVNAPRLNFQMNEHPEMGLPTPEDPSVKKSNLVIIKERERLNKLVTDKPSYMYLIVTLSSLIRCMKVDLPQNYEPPANQPLSPYQIEDLGYKLSSENLVLFTPDTTFIVSLFEAARKARSAVALSQCYVHYSFYTQQNAEKLFQVVMTGLDMYDFDKIRPFLILFQHMLESSVVPNSPLFSQMAQKWLEIFFKTAVRENMAYYQWMEVVTDWIIKVACRIEFVRQWMHAKPELWSQMIEWYKQNPEPPMPQYQDRNSVIKLFKPQKHGRPSPYRFQNSYRNKGANFMRRNSLIQIKQGQFIDLSHEIDIDYYHLDDFKLQKDQRIMILEDKHMSYFVPAIVAIEMDELCSIRFFSKEYNQMWEPTDKGRMFIEEVWENSHRKKELDKFEDIFRRQAKALAQQQREQEALRHPRDSGRARVNHEDVMDIDENPSNQDEGAIERGGAAQPAHIVNAQDGNEEMLDETEQDVYDDQQNNGGAI